MGNKKRLIKANVELKERAAKLFGVTVRSVDSALNYQTEGSRPNAIRAFVLNNGGTLFQETANPYKEVKVLP